MYQQYSQPVIHLNQYYHTVCVCRLCVGAVRRRSTWPWSAIAQVTCARPPGSWWGWWRGRACRLHRPTVSMTTCLHHSHSTATRRNDAVALMTGMAPSNTAFISSLLLVTVISLTSIFDQNILLACSKVVIFLHL